MRLKMPPKRRRATPALRVPKKRKPSLPAPKPEKKVERPHLWQRDMAGVNLSRPKGPGEVRLDALCRENGWVWGVVSTRFGVEGEQTTTVLVGQLFEASSEYVQGKNDPAVCWDEHDQNLRQIAEQLEQYDGGEG